MWESEDESQAKCQVFYKDVEEATEFWSEGLVLGDGPSSTVFSGKLFGKLGVAVKKLRWTSANGTSGSSPARWD